MSNVDKYRNVFLKSLSIDASKLNDKLKYNDIPEWDSIGHMTLISGLEDEFKISIETDDIVDFSSFEKGKEILKNIKLLFNLTLKLII